MAKPRLKSTNLTPPMPELRISAIDRALDMKSPAKPNGLSLGKLTLCMVLVSVVGLTGFLFYMDHTNSKAADEMYSAVQDDIAQVDYPAALIKLDEAIKHKDKPLFFYTKFKVLSAEEKYYEAGLNIEKAIQREPSNAAYVHEAGTFYTSQGQDGQKGLTYLKRAVELEPKNSDYRLSYGSALEQFGRVDEGIKILEKLVQDDPNYYSVWNDLAALYSNGGYPEKALQTRLAAVKKFPNDAYHWFWLGNAYDWLHRKNEAIQAYSKSIALEPETGMTASYRIAALSGAKVPERYREIVEDSIPVVYRDTHAFISASIDGHPGTFLLDTGATDSVLFKRFLDKNHGEVDKDAPRMQFETGGGIISAPVTYADIKVGRFMIENARVAVSPSPKLDRETDGVIGMNVLKNFNVRMDNLRGTLLFSRK